MKTIAFIVCLLGTIFLKYSDNVAHYRRLSEQRQKQIDSLTVMMYDLKQDTIVHKMLTDFAYRTKVNTLVKVLPDEDIIRLINKYQVHRSKKGKKQAVLALRTKKRSPV